MKYHKCPGCSTIFTKEDISKVIVTENDGPNLRNLDPIFDTRAKRLTTLVKSNGIYIDFGCGNGEFVAYLQNTVKAMAIGIDKHTRLQLKDLHKEAHTGVFMIEVIEHLENPIETIKELLTLVEPHSGWIYIESTFAEAIQDKDNHPYVDPQIGHRTIISRTALDGQFHTVWFNDNAVLIRNY